MFPSTINASTFGASNEQISARINDISRVFCIDDFVGILHLVRIEREVDAITDSNQATLKTGGGEHFSNFDDSLYCFLLMS